MSRILRYLACLFMLIFAGNALAGAYYCPSMKKYTRCEQGYYVDDCGSYRDGRLLSTTRLTVGNECASCPTGYSCQGGRYCPERAGVTVKYNLNGGSGTAPADKTCNQGVACTLDKGTSTTYYRAGYVLIGWSTDPDATTGVWSMFISSTETVNLYAVWRPCAAGTYKGGSGVTPISACSECPEGYRDGPAATSEQGCIMNVDGGYHVATANASTATECVAGTYKEGPYDVNYGSTSTCDSCPALTDGFEFPQEIAGATSWSGCAQVSYDAHAVNEYCAPNSVAQSFLMQIAASPTTWGAGGMSQGAAVDGAYLDTSIAYDPVADWSKVCQLCPAGYRDGSGANNINGCVMNVDGGYHVGTANASTATQCSADTYMGAHDVNYGSTSTCDTCPSGYPNSVAGSDAITDCYSDTKQRPWTGSQVNGSVPSGCYSVTAWNSCSNGTCSYTAYSNEDGTADGAHKSGCTSNDDNCTKTPSQVTARAGHYVSGTTCPACNAGRYQGTNGVTVTSCSVCSGNTYAEGTGNTKCTTCDTGYTISGTATTNHDERSDCRITCEPGTGVFEPYEQCTTKAGTWYIDKTHTVNAGDTSDDYMNYCIAGYSTPRTTSPSDHDAVGDCTISCNAGTQIAKVNATRCTTPSGNWYIGAHSVSQGDISPVNNCLTNYTITGTSPSNHDNFNDCKISCDGGEYLATKNATSCSDVTPGYWAAPSTVSQGSTGVRNACASGLTTIGFGAGADEAGDCGRVLHIGDDTLYLRSDKKTTHALHVGINGTTFYGNMGTDLSRGSLRIKLGSTTYFVYDDSME